jgi:O-antigen ligase
MLFSKTAVSFSVFLAFTPFTVFFSQYLGIGYGVLIGDPWLPMEGWLLIGSLIFVLVNLVTDREVFVITPLLAPLAALLCWFGVSTLWADNKYLVLTQLLLWIAAFLGFLFVTAYKNTEKIAELLLRFLFFSGVVSSALGLSQYYLGAELVFQSRPPSSVFGNKNMAAQFSLLTIPLGWTIYVFSKSYIFKFFVLTSGVISLFFILVVDSNAINLVLVELLVLALFVLAFFYLKKNYGSWVVGFSVIFVCMVILGVTLILSFFDFDALFSGKFTHGDELFSIQLRLFKWLNAWVMFKDNYLLGIGLNNWVASYPLYHQIVGADAGVDLGTISEHAHNDFLQILVELGIVGGVFALLLLVNIFTVVIKIMSCQCGQSRAIAGSITFSLVAILTISLFSFPLQLPLTIYIVVVFIGLLSGLAKSAELKSVSPRHFAGQAFRRVAICGLSIAALLSGILYYNLYNADIWYRKAHHYHLAGHYDKAMRAADIAVSYNPYRYETLKYRAASYYSSKDPAAEAMSLALLDHYPNSLNGLNRLFDYYMQDKKYMNALNVAVKIKSMAPYSAYAHRNMVLVYSGLKNKKGFVASLVRLKEINANHYLVQHYIKRQAK